MMYFVAVLMVLSLFTSNAFAVKQVELLKRNGKENEIPLLDNRFRVDSQIKEITLLFFRKPGTPAVILVRPDGAKYFAINSVKDTNIEWFDEISYDLVVIKNPMPGPWQVIGSISPDSRIVVLGEISLETTPLPPLVFRGETIKITGQILNDGEPINANLFSDVVSLNVDFVSTNNEDYANFGAGTLQVTSFKDNGRGFDERPKDGVFTGEFKLDFPAGEWTPELYITTPLLQRRVVNTPIIVLEPPFKYDIALADDINNEHKLTITIDNQIVKPETIIFQGKIYYPNNEEQMFTIEPKESDSRELIIKNYDWGRYSVELSVFGTNKNGREFMATLPTYKFEIARPIEAVPEIDPATLQSTKPNVPVKPEQETLATSTIISLIIGCNVLILLLGWLAIRIFVQKKPIKFKVKIPFLNKKASRSESADESEKKQADKNGSKNDKSGEILNLSMSDD